ncbi:ABC transporter ATP-binding protein [Aliidiomarina maris]|uniref:Methionine ABC transporter ATP-binding protein n=1 Tax=Aliidiomarina maris TaxID=531312 RepID=A0A327WS18_9GAMM|nr:ABC transporter ATP-binding protein [Aliidiomarina maris]RAJ94986.1 putative ABC transport system ATP-binding protein [Aliidiomarina maris]RUO22192.1 methionine ABC transporter ATP-binding protein [Aliidiomarina maris]
MQSQPAVEHPPLSIAIQGLRFSWQPTAEPVLAIDALTISSGERVFLHGPSGSGKSTLLSLLAGVHTPQQGSIEVQGRALERLSQSQRDTFRADHIGYIFQQFNLLPFLDLIHNVTLACDFSAARRQRLATHGTSATAEAARLLKQLGIPEALHQRQASQLSVGQQQRVAAARALIGSPPVVIADEPTSALDANSRENFLHLLFAECERARTTLVFVSHDQALAPLFSRSVDLSEVNR